MSLFHAGLIPASDTDNNPLSGATWNFYLTGGTSTPTNVYSNSACTTSLGVTVTADAAGRFANMFVNDAVATRAILKDAGGATIRDIDPVTVSSGAGTIVSSINVAGGTTGLTFSGGPVTTSGTITAAGTLAVASGGTGANDATNARLNFGMGNAAVLAKVTTAQFLANTADKVLTTDQVWAAAVPVALTDAATIALDMSLLINATLTIGGNRNLGVPTNIKYQSGFIKITQDATGGRTLGYASIWDFLSGVAPVLSTAAGAVDVLFYQAISPTSIYGSLNKAIG